MFVICEFQTYLFLPISQLVVVVLIVILCVYQEPGKLGLGLIILAAGVPVYLIGVKWKAKPHMYTRFRSKFGFIQARLTTHIEAEVFAL